MKLGQDARELCARHMKEAGVGEDAVEGGEDEVRLTRAQIYQALDAVPDGATPPRRSSSFGTFLQCFTETQPDGTERRLAAINQIFPGFGKLTSRFLHLFDPAVLEATRAWNQTLGDEALLLEDCDASFFNANLHPPLMPYEVWSPNSHNSLPVDRQLAVTGMQVRYDAARNRLDLIHTASGKPVRVFDLGFEGPKGRSQLFKLLEHFTLAEYLHYYPCVNVVNSLHTPPVPEGEPEPVRIRMVPRVVYADRLVLQRQTWSVPRALLPLKEHDEGDWAYFARLHAWREAHGMPDEVFVYVAEGYTPLMNDDEEAGKTGPLGSKDDYKPQYISFKNPFLVQLLARLMPRVRRRLRIVEMLPHSGHLMRMGGRRYVTELAPQWYSYVHETE